MTAAEKKADSMKDDYISVEHLFWDCWNTRMQRSKSGWSSAA